MEPQPSGNFSSDSPIKGFLLPNPDGVRCLTVVLVENFSLIAFSSMIEALRLANMIAEKELYQWSLLSATGEDVTSSCGVRLQVNASIHDCFHPRNIVVVSGIEVHKAASRNLLEWLQRNAKSTTVVGGVCTATYLLARAGLLDDFKCTIHWANYDGFIEEFGTIDVRSELFEIDRNRFTCAGGMAAADMMLEEIHGSQSIELTHRVCEQFMLERIRSGSDAQRVPLQNRMRLTHPKLLKAIAIMEKNTEEVLMRDELAWQIGVSRRQLERLFKRYLNVSPGRYYLKIRLLRAKHLLTQTSIPITQVAFACGFTSSSHFSKCYRDMFGHTPRIERNNR
ncbi:MAG: GlxA family transcriptional regulator [Alphaproteobacteria bacterium]|nr:GlxA family transcriptional regulator [Alphaproteobacteria bacterium]